METFVFSSKGSKLSLNVPTRWTEPLGKIIKKASAAFGEKTCFELLRLGESYSSEAASSDIEPCAIKLLRSLETLGKNIGKDSVLKGLADILPLFKLNEISPLPSVDNFEKKMTFPFNPITSNYKYKQTSLSLSSPTAFSKKVEINLIVKYFNSPEQVALKIKLGMFKDICGDFYCEIGCVLSDRTMSKVSKNLDLLNRRSPIGLGMLQRSKNNVLEYIRERNYLAGLDLTPAFFHMIRLMERFGGKFIQPQEAERYINIIKRSVKHTILHRQQYMKSINEGIFHFALNRYQHNHLNPTLVSLLLHNKMILDYKTDKPLLWIPPRMIYRKSEFLRNND